jgi:hypothetical protein
LAARLEPIRLATTVAEAAVIEHERSQALGGEALGERT